jgi:hypothetical protein
MKLRVIIVRYFFIALVIFSLLNFMIARVGLENALAVNGSHVNRTKRNASNSSDAYDKSKFSPLVDDDGRTAYLYSAFLDQRDPKNRLVRVLAILEGRHRPRLDCEFRSANGTSHKVVVKYYEMCENHMRRYGSFMLLCQLPDHFKPFFVAVGVNDTGSGRVVLPLRMATGTTRKKHKFGVCIPPIFGNIRKETLVEFIEMTSILGAEKFVFYDYDSTEAVRQIFRYYVKTGRVVIQPWRLPALEAHSGKKLPITKQNTTRYAASGSRGTWYHGQSLAINDCLYKYMDDFEYLSFNDIDEFLIPTFLNSWEKLMRFKYRDVHAGYCVESAFFDPTARTNKGGDLVTQKFTSRTTPVNKSRRKCIVRPERIVEMGIHHVSRTTDEKYAAQPVDSRHALLHHYRKCVRDSSQKTCSQFIEENRAMHFSQQLRAKFVDTLQILNSFMEEGKPRSPRSPILRKSGLHSARSHPHEVGLRGDEGMSGRKP